jgi:hypothetical protein
MNCDYTLSLSELASRSETDVASRCRSHKHHKGVERTVIGISPIDL